MFVQELLKKDPETLISERLGKFRKMGAFDEDQEADPYIKRNMKKTDATIEESSEVRQLVNGVAAHHFVSFPELPRRSEN